METTTKKQIGILSVQVTNYAELPEVLGAVESAKKLTARVAEIRKLVDVGYSFSHAVSLAKMKQAQGLI